MRSRARKVSRASSVSGVIPAPVGGWNARDPLASMDPRYARSLINFFPQPRSIVSRNGYISFVNLGASDAVETLVEHCNADGTRSIISAANGTLYAHNSAGTLVTSSVVASSNDRWQSTSMSNITVLANGVTTPRSFNGTTFSATTFTGVTQSLLINPLVHKTRMWFVKIDSLTLCYAPVASVTGGALTEYDVSIYTRRGGFIQSIATWTRDGGSGPDDFLIVVTSAGELLVFQGDFPGVGGSWAFVGRYLLPEPLGRRCLHSYGGDVFIITEQGVLPLNEAVGGKQQSQYIFVTDMIQSEFVRVAAETKNSFGWEMCSYPNGTYMLVNVPLVTNEVRQYAMNTLTGAWCELRGQTAWSWCTLDGKLYFGGSDGRIYRADTGASDFPGGVATPISVSLSHAFSDFGNPTRKKRLLSVRPFFETDASTVSYSLSVDADFQTSSAISIVDINVPTASAWDTSPWDDTPWSGSLEKVQDWRVSNAIGHVLAPVIAADLQNATLVLNSTQLLFEEGGTL